MSTPDLMNADFKATVALKSGSLLCLEESETQEGYSRNETEDKNWRPPISIQDVVASSYFRFDHGGKAAAMESFLKYMCPFAAGVDSWQINRLPSEESYIEKMIACFDSSYKDLQSFQRRGIVNWVSSIWKRNDMNAQKAIQLKNFFLDFPIGNIRNVFSYDEVVAYVDSGVILKLDNSHVMFDTVARYITRTIMTSDASKFGDSDFMYKLGKAKCVIKARKIKKSLDAASLKRLLDYNLKSCKDREEELADSLEECTGDASSRLQRCQLLQFEMSKLERKGGFSVSSSFSFSSSFSTSSVKTVQMDRPSIQEYENMKIVMDSFKEESNKALSEFTSSDIRNVASAFGVLKPKEIDQLPDDAILENIDVLKNNTNLSRKQKSTIFVKMVSAGFEVTTSESIVELGEFVTSVPPAQFKQLDSTGIQDSLEQLSKHAKEFSRAQKTAIMETLTEADSTNWTTILQQDLGELATEIPLSDLDDVVIEKDNLKEIGKQPWSRGQAANLFRKYRQSAGLADDTLTPDDIRDMGRTSSGVSCKEFMKILDDVSYDAAQALVKETDGSLTYDMNDCVSKKVHYSLQVLNGVDYIANDTGTDLSTTLEYIPGDIAMLMPTDQLEKVPATACIAIMANIGKAKIDMIPLTGDGMDRRKSLANITMKCIEKNRLSDDPIDVTEALTFGRLMCDLEVEHWEKFDLESFIEMFSELRDCFYRLSKEKIKYMLARVLEKYGDSSSWTGDILAALGPTIALMEEIVINDIPEDVIYEALDDISPPQLDSELPAHEFMKYDAMYNKFLDSVMSQRESSRRRRQIAAPDYDEMVVLGAGNVALTEAQLRAVTDEDFSNALSILGAINNWAMGQMSTLVDKLKSIYGSVETWASKVIKDAQHLIKGLTADELAQLVIDDIETASQMANVNFTNEEKFMLVEAYLKGAGVELTNLSSSELSGFASLACGIVKEKLAQIPDSSITVVLNDLGDLDCFSQEQFDYLKQVAVAGRDSEVPTAPELYEMGTIAAGLSSDDLAALPVDSISFIKPAAFMKITPSRIRDGLNASQLLAAGAGNVAALMTPEIFDLLTIVQRNALRVAAYGAEAELEDESATGATPTDEVDEVDPDSDDDGGGDGGDDDTDPGDNAADDENMTTGVKSSTTKSLDGGAATTSTTTTTTTTGSSAAIMPSFYNMLFLLIVTTALMCKRF